SALLAKLLQLSLPPVAISFVETPPAGLQRVPKPEPAGCGYWRRAAEGEVFYTLPDDHKSCPIGAHTHHVEMSPAESASLMELVTTMVSLSYIKMEEVPNIPRRTTALKVAVYGPLSVSSIPPDVVVVRGSVRQLMLLTEAAQ